MTKLHLRPLKNNVMFTFLDTTGGSKGRFTPRTTESGIILVPSIDSQKVHRWGKVVAVGPDCYGLEPGDYVLIESLMWMEAVNFKGAHGDKIWKTDDSKVLVVTNDLKECHQQ